MGIFSASGAHGNGSSGAGPKHQEGGFSIIALGTRFVGDIETDGVLKIEGKVEGSVRAEQRVLVARGGVVIGDIFTRDAVASGEVRGSINADQRVELEETAVVRGDITTPALRIHEGGQFDGQIRMGRPEESSRQNHLWSGDGSAVERSRTPVGVHCDGANRGSQEAVA